MLNPHSRLLDANVSLSLSPSLHIHTLTLSSFLALSRRCTS
ncbi:unnamed protein product [Brassica rapa]|uniref:Uncharacterized protein n=1 Tax=Brassica campestris TaxID=3711 RepID=A0A8D9GHJ6_BRACM|nr:unnamed protein product [Brassica rapa]